MTETRKWIRTARCEDIPLREGRSVKLGAREIAIFNLGDRFLAVASHCPHKSGPLAEGIISGQSIVCPLHAWKVDLETGAVTRPTDTRACVETFRARVEGGIVMVELPAASSAERGSHGVCFDRSCMQPIANTSCLGIEDPETGNVSA